MFMLFRMARFLLECFVSDKLYIHVILHERCAVTFPYGHSVHKRILVLLTCTGGRGSVIHVKEQTPRPSLLW